MVIDYEAAWHDLQEAVAGKTQHGREGLLTDMALIAARHRVPSGELSRLLRLYSIEVERARVASMDTDPDTDERLGAGFDSAGDADRPGHHDQTGGHDGRAITGSGR